MNSENFGSAEGWLMNEVRPLPKKKRIFPLYAPDGSSTLQYQCPYCDYESPNLEDKYCPQCGNPFQGD